MRVTLLLLLALGLVAGTAHAQDRRWLEEHRAVVPEGKPAAPLLAPVAPVVRVLLAGDSWAQYMWDDGSHNDVFDRFGHHDKRALSLSLGSDPGPGYPGPEYAISGSEARQWADTANYPWIANLVAALGANPQANLVMLSIGGNDVLAGKPDGGWYKDMDLDVPGSEAALFTQIHDDTYAIIDAAVAVRPEVRVMLSSYDYPNFNVGFWCFVYACPERRDLSRNPTSDLITDQELNGMMVTVEGQRIGWTLEDPRVFYDHAVGLMHYSYGDGTTGPKLLPYPGQTPPDYTPFPGGNPLKPTLRANFRKPSGIDADPIHLNYDGYQYKIISQTETTFFPEFRGTITETFFAQGGGMDGWSDGVAGGTTEIRVGRSANGALTGILSFDTSSIPDGAVITGADLYLHRKGSAGTNPFLSGALGAGVVDVATGFFGAPAVEASDASAPADAVDAGWVIGSARANGYAVRVHLDAPGLLAVNDQGTTQFRVRFPSATTGNDYASFSPGGNTAPPASSFPTLAQYMNTADPFLDVTYEAPATGVADSGARPTALKPVTPNPVRVSASIPFVLDSPARVSLRVHDVAGRLVAVLQDAALPAGPHTVIWGRRDAAGRRVPAGVYLFRLELDGRTAGVTRAVVVD